MSPVPDHHQLDLDRLNDLGLESEDIRALLTTLESDLNAQINALSMALNAVMEPDAMHRQLHALKGMAGMLGQGTLLQSITEADDAWREKRPDDGLRLTQAVMPSLRAWLAEARDWLQRYSSG